MSFCCIISDKTQTCAHLSLRAAPVFHCPGWVIYHPLTKTWHWSERDRNCFIPQLVEEIFLLLEKCFTNKPIMSWWDEGWQEIEQKLPKTLQRMLQIPVTVDNRLKNICVSFVQHTSDMHRVQETKWDKARTGGEHNGVDVKMEPLCSRREVISWRADCKQTLYISPHHSVFNNLPRVCPFCHFFNYTLCLHISISISFSLSSKPSSFFPYPLLTHKSPLYPLKLMEHITGALKIALLQSQFLFFFLSIFLSS